ncbi:hypothetical protein HYH03_016291 [Edaphochlamys debaryana]|uniref:Uncharacterized protein n=1 Tax=Edaphochlamys debaryana TaxID=47281 RepID=A0A835XK72_9CHLO|nr:hypothetical protein HYH03_016291 [Edaphochlamys debaryana]|eukprot:KAG2484905.1 hypothetical protein HYH03_016291 [Edaphochlamys debaryana]
MPTACPPLSGFEAAAKDADHPGHDLPAVGPSTNLTALAWACFRSTDCMGLTWSYTGGRGVGKINVTARTTAAGSCLYAKEPPKLAAGWMGHACTLWSGRLKCWG